MKNSNDINKDASGIKLVTSPSRYKEKYNKDEDNQTDAPTAINADSVNFTNTNSDIND